VAGLLRPALALKARAVRLVKVTAGTEVGYGGTWRAERPSVIATLPIGYADGWARASSPGAEALVHGRRVPLVGRVSMDAIGVDVTDALGVDPSDELVLLGRQGAAAISPDEIAAHRGTISREVIAGLGPRIPRIYLRGGRPVAVAALAGGRLVEAPGA
jgi:alanine racemase